ncbi:acyl-CoA dehydrogenase, partial [bacterium]|nr:acyl-CoA dehydrogenase [bacterium]
LQYAKERVQGSSVLSYKDPNAPRVTIIEHPDVKRMLAEMKAYSEGTRSLLYYLAECLDKAENDPDEAVRAQCSNMVELLTPIAKAYPTDRAFECASTAIQIMGGVGYCKEYPVEQYCRDAKISAIYEGTNGVQALDLVGRKMSQGGGALFMTYMQSLGEYIDAGSDHEEVVDLLKDLTKGRDKITEIAMVFMNSAKDNPIYPVLSATPFLEAFGHVIVAQRLIVQASIAVGKLKALAADKGESNYAKLAADNDDAKFYYNKLLTARFFCKNILPAVEAIATRIGNSDESVLQMAL